jgi:hypothetical protein
VSEWWICQPNRNWGQILFWTGTYYQILMQSPAKLTRTVIQIILNWYRLTNPDRQCISEIIHISKSLFIEIFQVVFKLHLTLKLKQFGVRMSKHNVKMGKVWETILYALMYTCLFKSTTTEWKTFVTFEVSILRSRAS